MIAVQGTVRVRWLSKIACTYRRQHDRRGKSYKILCIPTGIYQQCAHCSVASWLAVLVSVDETADEHAAPLAVDFDRIDRHA
jgi:hypothetical protein